MLEKRRWSQRNVLVNSGCIPFVFSVLRETPWPPWSQCINQSLKYFGGAGEEGILESAGFGVTYCCGFHSWTVKDLSTKKHDCSQPWRVMISRDISLSLCWHAGSRHCRQRKSSGVTGKKKVERECCMQCSIIAAGTLQNRIMVCDVQHIPWQLNYSLTRATHLLMPEVGL